MKTKTALAISLALAGPAFAADLPSRRAPAPYIPVAPVFTWSGFYGGLNLGGGFGSNSTSTQQQSYYNLNSLDDQGIGYGGPLVRSSSNLRGVIGGAQIGFNFQVSPMVVLGVETDFQGSGMRATTAGGVLTSQQFNPNPGAFFPLQATAAASQSVDWYGSLRGRVGFTPFSSNVLIYGTGGLAYGSVRQSYGYNSFYLPAANLGFIGAAVGSANSTQTTRVGWTAGGGVEWAPAFMPNWSLKLEYLYTDLGTQTLSGIGSGARLDGQGNRIGSSTSASATRFNTVRVGANYRFNLGTP